MTTKAGEVLSLVGDLLAGVAPIVGGPAGAGLAGAARIVRTGAALLVSGRSVDEVLAQMKTPPVLTKPWDVEVTPPERPSAKGKS